MKSSDTDPVFIYQSQVATVTYSQNTGYVQVIWHSVPATIQSLQTIYEQSLLGMKRFEVRKVLSDNRLRLPLPVEVRRWVAEDWLPRAILEADHSHAAVVTTSAPHNRLTAYLTPLGLLMQTHYFDTIAQADAWLRSQF